MNSDAADWRYEAIIPKTLIDKEAHEIQIWSAVGLFICIISGFGIASYLAKKNYNPLRMLMENVARYNNSKSNDKMESGVDEYQWLNHQMESFFQGAYRYAKAFKKQPKNIKNLLFV